MERTVQSFTLERLRSVCQALVTCLLLGLGCCMIAVYAELALNVVYSWRYVEYQFDSPAEKADATQSGAYYFRNNIPYDVEVVPDGRIFMTVGRTDGVPASLMTVTNEMGEGGGPLLRPYPDWSWTDVNSCDSIISVHRVAQDECNHLWVLDSGKYDTTTVCAPKLLAFDLTTDQLIKRVDIPKELTDNESGEGFLVNVIIDTVGENCAEIDVYMADVTGWSMVIYNGKTMWRIDSPYFEPDPDAEGFSVHGISFNLTDGLLGMALTRDEPDVLKRLLYFRPLASYDMYHTKAVHLHLKKNNQSSIEYSTEPTKLQSQSAAQAFSSQGILFFSGSTELSILCWNRNKPFTEENIVTVAQDEKTLQWASGIKVHQSDEGEQLWVMTNRYQEIANGKMNYTKTNFRILSAYVEDLVSGTACES